MRTAIWLALGLSTAGSAQALDYTWFGGDGNWATAANWLPGGLFVPGAGDRAIVTAGTVTLGSTVSLGALNFAGGTLAGTGGLTVSGAVSWTGGAFSGTGTHRIEGNTSITGAAGKTIQGGRVLQLAGATNWGGNTAVNTNYMFFYGGTLANQGAFTDANSFDTYAQNFSGSNAFSNSGSYTKTGVSVTDMQVAFNNTGSVVASAGRLRLGGGGTSTGSYAIASGATVDFYNGTHTLNNASSSGAGTLEVSGDSSFNFVNANGGTFASQLLVSGGNLQGTGATFTGAASWTGGAFSGTGTHRIEGNTSITGAARKTIQGGRVLQLAGATNWGGNTAVNTNYMFFYGGTLANQGAFTDANSFDTYAQNFSGSNAFSNSGSYTKTGVSVTDMQVAFNNTGSVVASAGRLRLGGGGTSTGSYAIASGATVDFYNGTHTLNNASSSGAGTLEVSGDGSFNFVNANGGTFASQLLVSGGNLQGTGATFTGAAGWTGGAFSGAGTHRIEGNTSITGAARKTIQGGRVLQLAGATNWGGNTAVNTNYMFFYGGTLANQGAFTDANSFDTYAQNFSGSNAFSNSGSYTKTGASVTDMQVAFNNTGSVVASAGRLRLGGGGTSTGSYAIASGATVDFYNGTHTLNNASSSGAGTLEVSGDGSFNFVNVNGGTFASQLLVSGGNLQGSGATFTGAASWTGGAFSGAGTHRIEGNTSITGAARKTIQGGRVLQLAGATNWGGNTAVNTNYLFFYGGTLANQGAFTDANSFDTYAQNFSGSNAFNNSGSYTKTGASVTDMQVAFNNTGTVSLNAGTLVLRQNFNNQGLVTVQDGATLQSTASTFTNANAATLQGNGTFRTVTNGVLGNSGTLAAGSVGQVGHLTLDGGLDMASGGIFAVDIASLTNFDLLSVTKTVKLAGTIAVNVLPNFTLAEGESFTVLAFDGQRLNASMFQNITWSGAGGFGFVADYNLHDVTLRVVAVPEPESGLLLIAGLLAVMRVTRLRARA